MNIMNTNLQSHRWHPRNWPLVVRLTMVMTLLILLTLVGVSLVTTRSARSMLADQIGKNFETQAASLSDLVRIYFTDKVSQLQALALSDSIEESVADRNDTYTGTLAEALAEIQSLDAAWVKADDDDPLIISVIDTEVNLTAFQLVDFLEKFEEQSEIFVTDRYGGTIASTGRLSDYYQADEGWWQAGWNDGKGAVYISQPEFDETAGISALLIAIPISDDETGEVIGVLRSTLNVEGLFALVSKLRMGQTGHAVLYNESSEAISEDESGVEHMECVLPASLQKELASAASGFELALDEDGDMSIFGYTALREQRDERKATALEKQILAAVSNLNWSVVVRQNADEAFASADLIVRTSWIAGLLALALGILVAFFLARIISRPLGALIGMVEQIASGDLTVSIPSDNRRDEIGVLTGAFVRMINSLQGTAGVMERIAARDLTVEIELLSEKDVMGNALSRMLENLRKQVQDIVTGADDLATSGSEILATTTQLASGSAETATSVSETTTTVEEVRQTAQVSTEKAKDISDSAQETARVSQAGEKSTEDTVLEMTRIKEQMDSIADSVVRLSEQSQAIGEIIGTVDDITEQSNLLAVNAAIEAAKAAEHGKGFAVVAEEIKTLSEQSKRATAQVRTILTEVQKATSSAVMVAEQGSKAAEAGVKQSSETGESIRQLTSSVAGAAQSAAQIAASSQQQLAGMDQIAAAMESINQTSSQTATGMKQLQNSAQDLNELGQNMKQLVEQYKL